MAHRSLTRKFGKISSTWRHLMTSSIIRGIWPILAICDQSVGNSVLIYRIFRWMMHHAVFSPERLLYLSRHMDKHFSKFQCIGINWWRHNCQNKPNLSIFPCIDHFLYLRFYDSVTLSAHLESFIKQSYNHGWNVVKISKMANEA